MLTSLPPELFSMLIEKLEKRDLKSLSQVTKYTHALVAHALWQSVTITAEHEDRLHCIKVAALPQVCFELATQFHLRSGFRFITCDRCPNGNDGDELDNDEVTDWMSESIEEEDEYKDESHFDCLTQRVKSVLGRFEDGKLSSFSWDLGTCVPSEILGRQGILSLRQCSLKSLSLITDLACEHSEDDECDLDLSSFRQLQSLRWKAPANAHLEALSVAIRSNSVHLRKLELDFGRWEDLWMSLDHDRDDDEDEERYYFSAKILQLTNHSPRPFFPDIRVLSLSHVPLGVVAMAPAINFSTLVSLTLRKCLRWEEFLERVLEQGPTINLTKLEIQDSDSVSTGMGPFVIADLLEAFRGLEELFITDMGVSLDSTVVWSHVAHHRATLRRFVYHQRVVDQDEESPYFEKERDLRGLGIGRGRMRQIRDDPSCNPLSKLDLECIGLSCAPGRLKTILKPFASKTSLKLLHIRQSRFDIKNNASWALESYHPPRATRMASGAESEDGDSESSLNSWIDSDSASESQGAPSGGSNAKEIDTEQRKRSGLFRREFRQFVDWIFGPQGVSSLQVVAFGDFAHGGRDYWANVVLCRSTDGRTNFRLLNKTGSEVERILDEYRDVLEACPVDDLFILSPL